MEVARPLAQAPKDVANQHTLLSRLERLDVMMWYLEEIHGSKVSTSLGASTASSVDSRGASANSSPRSLEKGCRSFEDVILETKIKGNLINRLKHLEQHVLQLSLQMEEEIESEKKKESEDKSPRTPEKKSHGNKKGLKSLVKSCVKGNINPKD